MLLKRFEKYISIDTQSNENSVETPSTKKQYDLLKVLQKELEKLGVKCELDKFGRLYGKLPGNKELDAIGLCAHVDTAIECDGKCDNYQVIKNYDGKDIKLGDTDLILSPVNFPKLNECVGKTLITTGGTSLLGGDDKAGLAIIMETIEEYKKLPVSERHPMSILFTPDEEVGRGPENFNLKKYGAKFAYTVDGADPKIIEFENFNAKGAFITIDGVSIHTGDAKGIMVNASLVLAEFMSMLPSKMIPAKTSGYEGFNHIVKMCGETEKATAYYILRNHNAHKLNKQVKDFEKIAAKLSKKYPTAKVKIEIKDQYRNMAEVIAKNPVAKKHIEATYKKLGLPYEYKPIRGGTDGATFSFLGCPCPNLGTGSYNHHGKYEFAVLEEMEQLVKICTEIYRK